MSEFVYALGEFKNYFPLNYSHGVNVHLRVTKMLRSIGMAPANSGFLIRAECDILAKRTLEGTPSSLHHCTRSA